MLLDEAICIVMKYTELFCDESIVKYVARNENLLPASKIDLCIAHKVYLAYVAIFKTADKNDVTLIMKYLNRMNSFLDDEEEIEYINTIQYRLDSKQKLSKKELKYFGEYLNNSLFCSVHDEVCEVLNKSQDFTKKWLWELNKNLDDHDFYKHIYEDIIKIKYKPEYGENFFNSAEIYHRRSDTNS